MSETYYSIGEIIEDFGFPVYYHEDWEIMAVWNGSGRFNLFLPRSQGWINPDVFHTNEEIPNVEAARKIAKGYFELLEKEREQEEENE
jgi:hypothetical protein